ncbi:MAG: RNA ligase family protein [Kofleriaceae bacterium]
MIDAIFRYPRTHHLEGSRLQPGDHDLAQVPLAELRGCYCVIEEKLDGANAGISLDDDLRVRLQSRGHVLVGGAREKHWDLFKQWAHTHEAALAARLAGLTLYGEWLYAKHTIFYDELPHYFMEFDIRDASGAFWSTARRAEHLAGAPIVSVPILWQGTVTETPQSACTRTGAPSSGR